MKGQTEITNTIGILVLIAACLFLFFVTLPKVIDLMWKEISYLSAGVVSRDLAGFITISGAAPNDIVIYFQPTKEFNYDTYIANRLVKVKVLAEGTSPVEKGQATAKTPIDPVASGTGNFFTISKSRVYKNGNYTNEYSVDIA